MIVVALVLGSACFPRDCRCLLPVSSELVTGVGVRRVRSRVFDCFTVMRSPVESIRAIACTSVCSSSIVVALGTAKCKLALGVELVPPAFGTVSVVVSTVILRRLSFGAESICARDKGELQRRLRSTTATTRTEGKQLPVANNALHEHASLRSLLHIHCP